MAEPEFQQSLPPHFTGDAMRRRRDLLVGGLAGAAFGLSGCIAPHTWFRYKLTVELAIDGRRLVGSAVREAHHYEGSGPMSLAHNSARGSAIAFDLGARGALIVSMLAWRPPPPPGFRDVIDFAWCPSRPQGTVDIMPGAGPMLLRLRAIDDPSDVRYVAPERVEDSFGPGVSLQRTYVALTRDPIDRKSILDQLAWARSKIKAQERFGEGGSWSIATTGNIANALVVKSTLML